MIIRANTTSLHTVYFYDENTSPVQPSSGTYQVKDLNSGIVVVTPTTFIPSTPFYVITLTPAQNAMLTSTDLVERRELAVSFGYGGSKQGGANEVLTLNGSTITIEDVMDNLLGWKLDTQVTDDEYDVEEDKVEKYIIKGMIRVANYLRVGTNTLPTTSDIVNEAVACWAAGLLWNWKYTVDTRDATMLPVGNNMIKDAKAQLTQYQENTVGTGGIEWTRDTSLGEWDETKEFYEYSERGVQDRDEYSDDGDYDEVRN